MAINNSSVSPSGCCSISLYSLCSQPHILPCLPCLPSLLPLHVQHRKLPNGKRWGTLSRSYNLQLSSLYDWQPETGNYISIFFLQMNLLINRICTASAVCKCPPSTNRPIGLLLAPKLLRRHDDIFNRVPCVDYVPRPKEQGANTLRSCRQGNDQDRRWTHRQSSVKLLGSTEPVDAMESTINLSPLDMWTLVNSKYYRTWNTVIPR